MPPEPVFALPLQAKSGYALPLQAGPGCSAYANSVDSDQLGSSALFVIKYEDIKTAFMGATILWHHKALNKYAKPKQIGFAEVFNFYICTCTVSSPGVMGICFSLRKHAYSNI